MTRNAAIALIKLAGYHGDTKTAMRIYIENRVSYTAYTEAYARGGQLKQEGMACTCFECNPR